MSNPPADQQKTDTPGSGDQPADDPGIDIPAKGSKAMEEASQEE